jgi:hypothetical protein
MPHVRPVANNRWELRIRGRLHHSCSMWP